MTEFFRFPRTLHLALLGSGKSRDDKVLSPTERDTLLAGELVVEEKIDGANVGLSVDESCELRIQNRGSYLERGCAHRQFQPLWGWLSAREQSLVERLWPNLILFGEWCHAVHSVIYDRLPDWFLGFDVYDRETDQFWDSARRDMLLMELGLEAVPRLAKGRYTLGQLKTLLGPSRIGESAAEGIVVRREAGGVTTARAKLVRAEFTQSIGVHWSRAPLRRNVLTTGAHMAVTR